MSEQKPARLLSISVGKIVELFTRNDLEKSKVFSAIRKQAISTLYDPVSIEVTKLGLKGDQQADLRVHGGENKAIYVYPVEHYPFWNDLLTKANNKHVHLPPGSMGENFTIEGLLEKEVYVGDTLMIDQLECTVTQLREPCFKFVAKLNYKGAAKAMIQSGFSGWYLRVNKTGYVAACAEIKLIAGPRVISIADQNLSLLKKN